MGNGKAHASGILNEKDYAALKKTWSEVLHVLGSVLVLSWLSAIIGFFYGIRAGLIVGIEKMLEVLKTWGE